MNLSLCPPFCSPKIKYIDKQPLANQVLDSNFNYTVFDFAEAENTKMIDRKKYFKGFLLSKIQLNPKCLFKTFMLITIIMLMIAIFRVYFFHNLALLQFVFNIFLVGMVGLCLYNQTTFIVDTKISNYSILNKDHKEIYIEENEEKNQSKLDQTIVQVFFGFLVALSFFITQVTTATYTDINLKVINVK